MKTIQLTQGKFAQVDDADFDWLTQWKWHAHASMQLFYAARGVRRADGRVQRIFMHNLLARTMGFSRPDHEDGNSLNNQRGNLRPATHSQNCANRGMRADNSSGYIGVHWHKRVKKWGAKGKEAGIQKHLGYYNSAREAALARDAFVKRVYGEFARLNFP